MIDKIILNARNDMVHAEAAPLHVQQSATNKELIYKKERADLRLSFLILENTREEIHSE